MLLIFSTFIFSNRISSDGIVYQISDWLVGVADNNENKMLIL
ncbi:MAG: hypothetical protein ACTS85_02420 [Arsenophonus sp. NC-PG7-MAG3]